MHEDCILGKYNRMT